MDTKTFVSKLDYDQLVYAKKHIEEKIAVFDNAARVTLWIVSDSDCNVGCYKKEDWKLAKKHLITLIESDSYNEDAHRHAPEIRKHVVSELEVQGWMQIND